MVLVAIKCKLVHCMHMLSAVHMVSANTWSEVLTHGPGSNCFEFAESGYKVVTTLSIVDMVVTTLSQGCDNLVISVWDSFYLNCHICEHFIPEIQKFRLITSECNQSYRPFLSAKSLFLFKHKKYDFSC